MLENPAGTSVSVLNVWRGVTIERKGLIQIEGHYLVDVACQHRKLKRSNGNVPGHLILLLWRQPRIFLLDDLSRPCQDGVADVVVDWNVALARRDYAFRQPDEFVAE